MAEIRVRGLKELARAFRQVDDDLPKILKVELLDVAEVVVRSAQQRMPHKSGRAQRSVKARATTKSASIVAGGTAAPYYHFLDFGGSVGRGHRPGAGMSGAVKRDMPKGGRYIYPAIAESHDEITKAADVAIKAVAKRADFDTHGEL